MIKEKILKSLVQYAEKSDDGLSLLALISDYKENTKSKNLKDIINNKYPKSMPLLVKIAIKCRIFSFEGFDVSNSIINYKQPIIIEITTIINKRHFVVCSYHSKKNEFLIWDSRNGNYCTSINGLISLQANKKCLAFL